MIHLDHRAFDVPWPPSDSGHPFHEMHRHSTEAALCQSFLLAMSGHARPIQIDLGVTNCGPTSAGHSSRPTRLARSYTSERDDSSDSTPSSAAESTTSSTSVFIFA